MSTPDNCCICGTQKVPSDLVFTWSRIGGYACRCHGCLKRRRRSPAKALTSKKKAAKKVAHRR